MFDFFESINAVNYSESIAGLDQGPDAPRLVLVHTVALGTHLTGNTMEYKEKIKKAGLRWKPKAKLWGVTNTAGHKANRSLLEKYSRKLEGVGFYVDVAVAEEDFEREKEKFLQAKVDMKLSAAKKMADVSEEKRKKAREIMGRIPVGQPVLTDHYSAGRHRNDIKKIERNMEGSVEAFKVSERLYMQATGLESRLSDPETLDHSGVPAVHKFLRQIKRDGKVRSVRKTGLTWLVRFFDDAAWIQVTAEDGAFSIADFPHTNKVVLPTEKAIKEIKRRVKLRWQSFKNVKIYKDDRVASFSLSEFSVRIDSPDGGSESFCGSVSRHFNMLSHHNVEAVFNWVCCNKDEFAQMTASQFETKLRVITGKTCSGSYSR